MDIVRTLLHEEHTIKINFIWTHFEKGVFMLSNGIDLMNAFKWDRLNEASVVIFFFFFFVHVSKFGPSDQMGSLH